MSLELISTAEHYGEAIDCRCLSFAFEFYQMSDKLIVDLSTEMVLWLNSFLKDGFYIWAIAPTAKVDGQFL